MSESAIPTKAWPAGTYFEGGEDVGFDVFSWSPEPVGSVNAKVTQVHLHGASSLGRVAWRFKSPRTLDALIDALITHREDVWGKR